MVHLDEEGIKPIILTDRCMGCTDCLSSCPGYRLSIDERDKNERRPDSFEFLIGSCLEIWEGHARDEDVRYRASSGGILSALSLYCLEREEMDFVLHTGMDSNYPWRNVTVRSRNREDLLSRAGSRYSPASPCDSLRLIEESDKKCVFIGKPCDAAAVTMLRKKRPLLDKNLGLVLTFFCAGAPCSQAIVDLVRSLGMNPDRVDEIRYRGRGWPGDFTAVSRSEEREIALSYKESWGYLSRQHRPYRCSLCPDGLGELADMSCGDAWHRYQGDGNPGESLVLVRSKHGRDILCRAAEAGYVDLVPSDAAQVVAAQGLVERRSEIFGRLLGMKMLFVPTPKFKGFHLFRLWIRRVSSLQKVRTVLGTMRRVRKRGLWHRKPVLQGYCTDDSQRFGRGEPEKPLRFLKLTISMVFHISDRITDLMRRFLGNAADGRCVVLYYHAVADWERKRFARQMDEVLRLARPVNAERIPRMEPGDLHVAVTFDDGFECVARNALPELITRGIPSVLFVPSAFLGGIPEWLRGTPHPDTRERVLSADAIRDLAQNPLVIIGSHCRTHRSLIKMGERDARQEIRESKTELEAMLGSKVRSISFPQGAYDSRHVEVAREAGYERLFSISPELSRGDERVIGRVRVDPGDWPIEFRLKVNGAYRWMAAASAIKRSLHGATCGYLPPASSEGIDNNAR